MPANGRLHHGRRSAPDPNLPVGSLRLHWQVSELSCLATCRFIDYTAAEADLDSRALIRRQFLLPAIQLLTVLNARFRWRRGADSYSIGSSRGISSSFSTLWAHIAHG